LLCELANALERQCFCEKPRKERRNSREGEGDFWMSKGRKAEGCVGCVELQVGGFVYKVDAENM
jgi:hypothetical protein